MVQKGSTMASLKSKATKFTTAPTTTTEETTTDDETTTLECTTETTTEQITPESTTEKTTIESSTLETTMETTLTTELTTEELITQANSNSVLNSTGGDSFSSNASFNPAPTNITEKMNIDFLSTENPSSSSIHTSDTNENLPSEINSYNPSSHETKQDTSYESYTEPKQSNYTSSSKENYNSNVSNENYKPGTSGKKGSQGYATEISMTENSNCSKNVSVDIDINISIDVSADNNSTSTIKPHFPHKRVDKRQAVAGIILIVLIAVSTISAVLFVLMPSHQQLPLRRNYRSSDRVELVSGRGNYRPLYKYYDSTLYVTR